MCRDNGKREDRQKARLMWLVEAVGVDEFRKGVAQRMGLDDLPPAVHVSYDTEWKRRDVIGIHPQKQVRLRPNIDLHSTRISRDAAPLALIFLCTKCLEK